MARVNLLTFRFLKVAAHGVLSSKMEKFNGQSSRYNQIIQLRKKTRVASQRANTTAWLFI
ncbi:hypothetical protein AMK81_18550 [Escherichia coli]|uniref:Uncharacterized protein n=1 Tax=Escherichia coli TaxID=562 RepID=A0A2A2CFN8_ECOLX|nr:hypothetical protein AMK81_18550 [Escherichia coli]PAU25509.1 hypothetical protein BTQ06_05150 [Escherichia coli]TFW78612.1 hypothetical protein DEO19_19870 [Escherichia coli]